VGSGAHLKINVRLRDFELPEEQIAHFFIIMLASMYENCLDLCVLYGLSHQRPNLNKVGTSANNVDYFHT
jgi:hypothetical protein